MCCILLKFSEWISDISRDGLRREDHFKETEDEVRFGVVEDRMMEFP